MKIIIYWNNINIVEVTKINDLYFSSINTDNMNEAKKMGLPIFLLSNIKVISKKLPAFVKSRIPSQKVRNEIIKEVSDNEDENILKYISITKCIFKTDNFKVDIFE